MSVLRQFVDRFAAAPDEDEVYVLATSLDASSTVRLELRKLTEAARLNELGPDANPLTSTEADVLALSAGREVVLAEDDEQRLLLFELIRFDKDGARRVRFTDDHVEFPKGPRFRVVRRAATFAGIRRLLAADPTITEGREVHLFPIQGEDDADWSPWALAQAELCAERMREGAAALECIACGRPIAESSPHAAEIDEEGVPHDAGLVHAACLRPTHRVIGRVSVDAFSQYQLPYDFDHRRWLATRPRGQAAFSDMSPALQGQIVTIGWKPGRPRGHVGEWGVAYTTRRRHDPMGP